MIMIMSPAKTLLAIIEIGGYPDFSALYQQAGYQVLKTNTMRKALSILNKNHPTVIVAEFIFGPTHSFVVSNIDSLLAMLASKHPETKLILFMDKTEVHHFEKLRQRYADMVKVDWLFYPIESEALFKCLSG